ncbi:MAG: DUF6883 domain-containing protein [Hormoscilla sp.]
MWGDKVKLPNSEKAVIDSRKLTGYCLNQNHGDGQHKARVFKAALDLDVDDVEELQAALLNAVKNYDAIPDKANQYGQKYIIDFSMNRGNKTAIIHSVWIVRNEDKLPHLVTCYVL